jgi:hypothetical protein
VTGRFAGPAYVRTFMQRVAAMRDSRSADESPHVQRNAREAQLTRLLVEAQDALGGARPAT